MRTVDVFSCGALILCWTLHVSHAQGLTQDPGATDPQAADPAHTGDGSEMTHAPAKSSPASPASRPTRRHVPCFVDDVLASLREAAGSDGKLTNSSSSLFGGCARPDESSSSVLRELAQGASATQRFKVVHPTGGLVAKEDEGGRITLTFDLPQLPLLKTKPVLLLMFESPNNDGDLHATFTSQWLQPDTQSVCMSAETQFTLLPGKASQVNDQQTWTITVETKSPERSLKDVFIGTSAALLLFSGETGTSARQAHISDSSPASSQTFSFLCELKRLLGDLQPQDQPDSPPIQLDSLQTLPPLAIDLTSSETLVAGLINSSAPTVFSFTRWRSTFPVHHGELSLSAALSDELGRRLQQTVSQVRSIIREEDVGHGAAGRLARLEDLSAFPKEEPATGARQYRAFLLLKALQTVARAYELQRGLRATRADPSSPGRANICGLRSLTVSLEKHVVGPNSANINNCHGSCRFPLANSNNHAVLLSSHLEGRDVDERAPCCVPVAYEALEVVNLNEHGTYLSIKPDMVARECGCR